MAKLRHTYAQIKGTDTVMNDIIGNPEWAEKLAKQRGGVVRYRMMKKGGKLYRVMVTKRAGPRGGKTIAYEAD